MRRLTFATVVALGAVTLLAGEAPHIGVVDMGFAAGRNEFGYMSDPKVFVEALAPVGNAFRVEGRDLAKPGVLKRGNVDLLVVPTGAAWPEDASQAFGLGATALLAWHWRDPMEGIFPCGLVHATGVERPAARLFSRIANAFGKLRLADNRPDVVVLLKEAPRMRNAGRKAYLDKAYAVDEALRHWGANWSKITESAIGNCKAKLVLDPDTLPTDDAARLTALVGERLAAAGCAFTRRAGDPETLDTYCVPGEGATGWVFWNGADKPVSTARGGHEITIGPERIGYLQVAADGTLEAKEEL